MYPLLSDAYTHDLVFQCLNFEKMLANKKLPTNNFVTFCITAVLITYVLELVLIGKQELRR